MEEKELYEKLFKIDSDLAMEVIMLANEKRSEGYSNGYTDVMQNLTAFSAQIGKKMTDDPAVG
jgi:hypothetical protein